MNIKRFTSFLAALAFAAGAAIGETQQETKPASWHDKDHKLITKDDVVDFLVEHRLRMAKERVEHPGHKDKDGRNDFLPDIAGCTQKLKGATLTGIDMTDLLAKAAKKGGWPKDEQPMLECLDLTHCILDGAKFSGLDMKGVILTDASLVGAHLDGVKLNHAFLTRASLGGASLKNASFKDVEAIDAEWGLEGTEQQPGPIADKEAIDKNRKNTNLTGASFNGSNLDSGGFEGVQATGMSLTNSTALGASFKDAILSHAKLIGSDVDKADFEGATLTNVAWEVRGEPDIPSLLYSKGLDTLTYKESPIALVRLRKVLMEDGVAKLERQVNLALQRGRTWHLWNRSDGHPVVTVGNRIEAFFRTVCFDLPCEYGMHPCRPLKWIGILLLVFAIPYTWILIRPEPKGKLQGFSGTPHGAADKPERDGHKATHATHKPAVTENEEASAAGKLADASVTGIRYAHFGKPRTGIWAVPLESRVQEGPTDPVRLHVDLRGRGKWKGVWRALRIGFLFSVISAFSTGFRDLDVGRWIERIKHDESTLRGTGWVRTLSGLQSLASFFLLALWLLTYFGRPFE